MSLSPHHCAADLFGGTHGLVNLTPLEVTGYAEFHPLWPCFFVSLRPQGDRGRLRLVMRAIRR